MLLRLDNTPTLWLQEEDNYSDPITEFVLSVWVDFDFPKAAALLAVCSILV